MIARVAIVLALFAAVALAGEIETLAVNRPNDLIIGSRIPGDRLIQRESVKKDASVIGKVVTVTKTFSGDRYSNISQIRALDQHQNGHGATAKYISGGVGYSFVTLRFESERFRAIDFVVEIYGR